MKDLSVDFIHAVPRSLRRIGELEVTAQVIAAKWAAAPRQSPTPEILDALQTWHPNIPRLELAELIGVATGALARVEADLVNRFAAPAAGVQ